MIVIDEHGPAAFDHPHHPAVDRVDLHDSLNDLHSGAMLIDDDGEGRALDHGSEHRRVDCEVRDAGVLYLE
jgi:hypothetical protein